MAEIFRQAFSPLRTRPDFKVKQLDSLFDHDTLEEIRQVVKSLRPAELEMHEATSFGRFVVHDHPFFTELQQRITPLVSETAEEPLEASYNFLSLYTHLGVCPPHMDSPEAKWTLDLCLDQNVSWPIYFSDVQPWPEPDDEMQSEAWATVVKTSPSLHFTSYCLQPGQSVLFSGSSQWHYRDAIPAAGSQRQFCDLLFFHFIPLGTSELTKPENWSRLFGIPELDDII